MVQFDELQLVCIAGYFLNFSFKMQHIQLLPSALHSLSFLLSAANACGLISHASSAFPFQLFHYPSFHLPPNHSSCSDPPRHFPVTSLALVHHFS